MRGEAASWSEPPAQDLTPQQIQIRDLIKERTGQNGYEEYIDATILSLNPKSRALFAFLRTWTPGSKPEVTADTPPEITEKTTLLEAYRIAAREAEPIFLMIQRGNAKPVFHPSEHGPATLYPEYAQFRTIAHLYRYAAIVDLADGNASRAAARLLEGIRFTRKFQTGTYIATLVAQSMEQVMLGVVDQNPRIMPVDFDIGIASLPNEVEKFKEAMDLEISYPRLTWNQYLSKPEEFTENAELIEKVKNLPKARADVIYTSVIVALEGPAKKARARLDLPESKWMDKLEPSPSLASMFKPSVLSADEGLIALQFLKVVEMFDADDNQNQNEMEEVMLRMLARIRVQRRLLAHTAAVSRYRWEHTELPKTLADVYGGKEPLDPLNGLPYRFARIGESFRISLDVKGIGTVTMLGGPRQTTPGGPIEP